ncbi:DUF5675 family protein [Haloflavibacter putidus]|uniref:DUF5675 family protein n=1 Tax=Haloflavibacter putidus TaxID=2576776 RepID=UPI001F34C52E|nr:DUF5675 family protein [Haloflavibacter putidus]
MIRLGLYRGHFPQGTIGALYLFDEFLSFTIELPWRGNQRNISAIPDGIYALKLRYSKKFEWHLLVEGVSNRDLILFHPANDALKELEGCIAPVSSLVEVAKGYSSRKALEKILERLRPYFLEKKNVIIEFKSSHFEEIILKQKKTENNDS